VTSDSELVLVWAPHGRDATLTIRLLERHGFRAKECRRIEELTKNLDCAGCAVLTAESMTRDGRDRLTLALAEQPPWSDFPLILFAPSGADLDDRGLDEIKLLGNVTILERPVHTGTLISAVRSALRGRDRQYEAREAIQRRDQFLAMLGHELRNPLAAITFALETMPPSLEVDRQRTVIDRQTRHLARLVDDLLDVARVTSGKVRLERQPVDLDEIVARCVQGAEAAARARRITVHHERNHEPLVVDGDLVRLEEVFNNLIGNALKYSPENTRVDITTHGDATTCRVDVIDQGIGIGQDMLPRVFDLFAQADVALDRSRGGLGIGLTLVRSLVELHGGVVSASSQGKGKGSRFTVKLPRVHGHLPRHTPHSTAIVDQPLKVVLVEDNADLLEMTRDLLESCGCEVATAPDGNAGLELLLAEQPDIAFVDIGLPGIDGYCVAQNAREQHLDGTYLVAMSGYGQPEDQQRAIAAGFDRHLTKPVTIAALRDAMGTAKRARI